jgi:very-short-patch-repair endonuclease
MCATEINDGTTIGFAFGQIADRHEQRRRYGLPTISTVVGPVALAQRLWRKWARDHQRPTVTVVKGAKWEWLEQWVATLLNERDLYSDAERFLASRLQPPVAPAELQLRRASPRQIELLLDRAELADYSLEPGRLCRWLLQHRAHGRSLSAGELVSQQMSWNRLGSTSPQHAFRQLIAFLGTTVTPALLVMPGSIDVPLHDGKCWPDEINAVHPLAEELGHLVAGVPDLTIGLAVSKPIWNAYVQRARDSFAKAVLQENVIAIDDLSATSPVHRNCQPARPVVTLPAEISGKSTGNEASATLMTGTPPCAELLSVDVESQVVVDAKKLWKSEHECFLFELLEASSDLNGLFQLNVKPGFKFGNKLAEIDLCCRSLKIAVEVDGFFHFQNADNYRRDRRKDLELQRQGYVVMRFLADDVVSEVAAVLDTIRAAVAFRKQPTKTHPDPKGRITK